MTGKILCRWGIKGSNPGQLDEPKGITFTKFVVFVVDSGNHRIQAFTHKGEFLFEIKDQDNHLRDIFEFEEMLYVTDELHNFIFILRLI